MECLFLCITFNFSIFTDDENIGIYLILSAVPNQENVNSNQSSSFDFSCQFFIVIGCVM